MRERKHTKPFCINADTEYFHIHIYFSHKSCLCVVPYHNLKMSVEQQTHRIGRKKWLLSTSYHGHDIRVAQQLDEPDPSLLKRYHKVSTR